MIGFSPRGGHFAIVTAARVGEHETAPARDRPLEEHVRLGETIAAATGAGGTVPS